MSQAELTPMLRQYRAIKDRYPDALLFFRLGDFYELFEADAEVAARELEIALTAREAGKGHRMAMCGVPYHSVEGYLSRLVARGYKVALCDQVEDPRVARGVVRREVVRVVTAGTALEPQMLDERRPNYLQALVRDGTVVGLARVEASTGDFSVTEIPGATGDAGPGAPAWQEVLDQLLRDQPVEVLLGPGLPDWLPGRLRALLPGARVAEEAPRLFDAGEAARRLLTHFRTRSLAAFGCEGRRAAVRAAGAALAYLAETQGGSLGQITRLTTRESGQFLVVDAVSQRNLEIVRSLREGSRRHTLLAVLDRTRTAMGARRLADWLLHPLQDLAAINARLDAVQQLVADTLGRQELQEALAGVRDLERLQARVVQGSAGARDLVALRDSLARLPAVREAALRVAGAREGGLLARLAAALDPLEDMAALLARALADDPPAGLREGGLIREGFDPHLDELRRASREGKAWVAGLEARERERTGIRSLKVGFNKVFGYYLEVTRPNLSLVPPDYERRQTLANAERFVTPELKEMEAKILGAEERSVELEYQLFCQVRHAVAEQTRRIQATADALATLDTLLSLAQVAAENGYVRPEVADDGRIEIEAGRHPVVEQLQREEPFVPNDVRIDAGEQQILILTGPNMGGKSTFLRQVALITLLAHAGSWVPARRAHVGLVDRIFTRVGAADDLATGQSTFMVEMSEVAHILHHATARSLILLDEVGRGTSTFDGLSLAWSIVEHIHEVVGAKTLFATHYHELTQLAATLPRVRNFSVAVARTADGIRFLRQIVPGGADESYGIEVAKLAGLPPAVTERAAEILRALEAGGGAGPAGAAGANAVDRGGRLAPAPARSSPRRGRVPPRGQLPLLPPAREGAG